MTARLIAFLMAAACTACAQFAQLGWDVQQDRPVPHEVIVWQGETVDLLPRLVQGIRPVAITNAPVEFRYREASLPTNTYRYVAASANTNNGVIAVRWRPEYDAGAPWYDYQVIVGSNAANPRCFGRIVMRQTIGWHASTNPPPPVTLYPTRTEFQALSNALESALQNAVTSAVPAQISASTGNLGQAIGTLFTGKLDIATTTGWETGAHKAWLTNESDLAALEALATNRVTKLETPDGSRWIDATGAVWSITQIPVTNIVCTLSPLFGVIIGPDAYDRPEQNIYIGEPNTQLDAGNSWYINFDQNHEGLFNVFNFYYPAYWSATGYDPPLVATGGDDNWFGTATFEYQISYTAVTSRIDTVATHNDLAPVAFTGQYTSLSNRPVVLASNGIARASHAWGLGYGGWSGWVATNCTLTTSNAVMTGTQGCVLQTVGEVTGIVSVSYSGLGYGGYANAANVALSYDGGQSWVGLTDLPAKSERTGGALIRITQPETAGLPGQTSGWTLYNVIVDTWVDSSRASEVFPLHAVSVRADLPSDSLDVANKAYVDALTTVAQDTANRALSWWNNPAQADAYMNGHRLHLGGGWSILGDTNSFAAFSNDGSVGLGVVGDNSQFSLQLAEENILIARFDTAMMQILSWSGAASNMWVMVSTNGLPLSPDSSSAWIEYSSSVGNGVWARAPIQTVSLPTNAALFRISFENPRWGESKAIFRVMRQSGTLAALRSMVPLRAPSMMISESNSVAIATSPGVIIIDSIAAAPAAVENHAQLYSVLGELWVMDGDGNATRLSTHDGPLWVARSCNVYTGWGTSIDMVSGVRTRFRLEKLRSWDDDQTEVAAAQNDAIRTWLETPADKRRTKKPLPYVAKPEPSWITEQKNATDDPQPIPTSKK